MIIFLLAFLAPQCSLYQLLANVLSFPLFFLIFLVASASGLKGPSHEKACEIITLNDGLGPHKDSPTVFFFMFNSVVPKPLDINQLIYSGGMPLFDLT
jgi:hypothetical protein